MDFCFDASINVLRALMHGINSLQFMSFKLQGSQMFGLIELSSFSADLLIIIALMLHMKPPLIIQNLVYLN